KPMPWEPGRGQRGQGMRAPLQLVTITSPSRNRQVALSPRRKGGGVYGPWSNWWGSRGAGIGILGLRLSGLLFPEVGKVPQRIDGHGGRRTEEVRLLAVREGHHEKLLTP